MGSFDCYCAICGGPFHNVQISRKPRTARFIRRRARETAGLAVNSDDENESIDGDGEEDGAEEGDDDEDESLGSWDEANSYDPEIISEADAEWTNTLHILGFNAEAPGISKAFISGPGRYSDYGGVDVEAGNDPNFKPDAYFTCYTDFDNQGETVFPFHWPCYELLCKALTGTRDVSKIDKDLLYNIMQELAMEYPRNPQLEYGEPGPDPGPEQFWCSNPGLEFLVCHPFGDKGASNRLAALIASDRLETSPVNVDRGLGSPIEQDPFIILPFDIVHKIACLLPVQDLFNFNKASWHANSIFRETEGFWRERIKNCMPWYFELQDVAQDSDMLRGKSCKGLLAWAEKMTTAKEGMKGPFMTLANRRRIWGVCEQLADLYIPRLPREEDLAPEEMIRDVSRGFSLTTMATR